MKKRYLFGIIAIFLLSLTIFGKNYIPFGSTNKIINTNIKDDEHKLTWDEYQLLFEYVVKNIDIEGLELKASTLGGNITAVDKELTFNKRAYLTIDGEFEGLKTTEEQIVLEDINQDKQFTISILYTDSYIGEDLIGYPTNAGFNDLNKTLVKKATYSILTYKNLVIVIHQVAIDTYDMDLMYPTIKSIVDLLSEYQ